MKARWCCALLALAFGGCTSDLGAAKDFKLIPLDDQAKSVSLADFKGKTILLDFWATTCGPCVVSMPEVQAAYDKFHAKGFDVLSISDEERAAVLDFHRQTSYTYPVYLDAGSVATRAYNVEAIPTFVLIRDGKVLWQQTAYRQGDIMDAVSRAMG